MLNSNTYTCVCVCVCYDASRGSVGVGVGVDVHCLLDERQTEHGVRRFRELFRKQNSFETYAKQSNTYVLPAADRDREIANNAWID